MPASIYAQSVGFFVIALAALFGSAGTVAIPAYWVYVAILGAVFVASFLLLDPDLALERMRPGGKRPPLALQSFSVVLVAHWCVAGLDHGRFHWSDSVPGWLQWLSLAALAAAYALCLWAMVVNRFFSSVVRIQSDRNHLITAGPYAVIRHPGYLDCARFLARWCLPRGLQPAVPLVPRHHRGPRAAGRIARLSQLRTTGSLAPFAWALVSRRQRIRRGRSS